MQPGMQLLPPPLSRSRICCLDLRLGLMRQIIQYWQSDSVKYGSAQRECKVPAHTIILVCLFVVDLFFLFLFGLFWVFGWGLEPTISCIQLIYYHACWFLVMVSGSLSFSCGQFSSMSGLFEFGVFICVVLYFLGCRKFTHWNTPY